MEVTAVRDTHNEFTIPVNQEDLQKRFALACEEGNENIALELLDQGLLVNQKDDDWSYPIFRAVEGNCSKVLVRLIDMGAYPMQEDLYLNTPLHLACRKGVLDCVKILLENPKVNINAQNDRHSTPLMQAIIEGQNKIVELLIHDSRTQFTPKDLASRTAWQYVCMQGRMDYAEMMLEKGNVPLMNRSWNGYTGFHDACAAGKKHFLFYLLKKGIYEPQHRTNEGKNAFHVAALHSQFNLADNLLESSDFSISDLNGKMASILHMACEEKKPDVLKFALERGASTFCKDHNGRTAMHVAASKKRIDDVLTLICYGSAEILLEKDHKGKSVLDLALESKQIYRLLEKTPEDILWQLIENEGFHQLNNDSCKDLFLKSPLSILCAFYHPRTEKAILENLGSFIPPKNLPARTDSVYPHLTLALEQKFSSNEIQSLLSNLDSEVFFLILENLSDMYKTQLQIVLLEKLKRLFDCTSIDKELVLLELSVKFRSEHSRERWTELRQEIFTRRRDLQSANQRIHGMGISKELVGTYKEKIQETLEHLSNQLSVLPMIQDRLPPVEDTDYADRDVFQVLGEFYAVEELKSPILQKVYAYGLSCGADLLKLDLPLNFLEKCTSMPDIKLMGEADLQNLSSRLDDEKKWVSERLNAAKEKELRDRLHELAELLSNEKINDSMQNNLKTLLRKICQARVEVYLRQKGMEEFWEGREDSLKDLSIVTNNMWSMGVK